MMAQKQWYDLALQARDQRGEDFPIWGTCLGFEALMLLSSKNPKILSGGFDSSNLTIPLEFTSKEPLKQSRLFGEGCSNATASGIPCPTVQNVIDILRYLPVTMNNHVQGVLTSTWHKSRELQDFYRVISTNKDRKGREFISTVEAKNYPIYGTQWHPEKAAFEWTDRECMDHSLESVVANQHMSLFFVNECRKNGRAFSDLKEQWQWLIYNWQPSFTYLLGSDFVQVYYFPEWTRFAWKSAKASFH